MSFAKVVLLGNLGRDPEMRYTSQGTPVCSFSMATSEKKKDKSGEYKEETTWWKVTLWGKQAETASQYLVKGKAVVIEGRPSLSVWTDKEGKERTTLEVNATDMHFVGNKEEGDGGHRPQPYQGQQSSYQQPAQSQGRATAPAQALSLNDDSDVPF